MHNWENSLCERNFHSATVSTRKSTVSRFLLGEQKSFEENIKELQKTIEISQNYVLNLRTLQKAMNRRLIQQFRLSIHSGEPKYYKYSLIFSDILHSYQQQQSCTKIQVSWMLSTHNTNFTFSSR